MESLQKQRIESPLITCVTRKVDSFSFDGGVTPKKGINKSDVECNVRNAITSAFSDENGVRFRQLNLVIELFLAMRAIITVPKYPFLAYIALLRI